MAIIKALKGVTKAAGKVSKKTKRPRATEGTAKSSAGARKPKTRKVKEAEGARKDPVTGGSVRAAREVDAGMSGRVNVGKKSSATAFNAQEYLSKSTKKRIEKAVEIERKKRLGTDTKEELKFLKAHYKQEAADLDRRNVKIGQGVSAAKSKKKEVDNYAVALQKAKESGELGKEFEQLTKNQQDTVIRAAQIAQKMKARKPSAKVEKAKKELQGPRSTGKKLDMSEVTTEAARKRIMEQKEKDRKRILGDFDKFKKGGVVTKKNSGGMDYRMNKGGMLISSVDRRKKK